MTHIQIPRFAWYLWLIPLVIWLTYPYFISNETLFYLINGLAKNIPIYVWVFFDFLGNAFGVFALTLFLVLMAPRVFVAGVIAATMSGIVGRVLKVMYALPRPAGILDPSTFFILGKPLTALSMPSGHTLTAFSIATAYFFCIGQEKRKIYLFVFVIATLTAISRIAIGAHWPNDLLAGASIGMFAGVLGAKISAGIPSRWLEINSWLMYLFFIASAIGIYTLTFTQLDFSENYVFQLISAGISLITMGFIARRLIRASIHGNP